jgi:TatD DNase family protein
LPVLSDTHCHIDFQQFDPDRQAMLDRAWQVGIQRLLIPAVDLTSVSRAIAIADSDERIYLAVGIHPNSADNWNSKSLDEMRTFLIHPRVCAIGEIGLDYYRDHTTPEIQKMILIDQLTLASETDKPVILHCRAAFEDLFAILTTWLDHLPPSAIHLKRHPGVFHSFGGDTRQAETAIQAGFCLGVNGSITFKNATATRDVMQSAGIDHLLLETDAPFITPVPHRGKRNEPAYSYHTNQALSALLNLTPDLCAKMTYNNACELFGW